MPKLNDLLSWADNKRRVAGMNLRDFVTNPIEYLDQTAYNASDSIRQAALDPMSYVGGGIGRVKVLGKGGIEYSAPTQAELAGRLHSLQMVDDRGARDIYRLGGNKAVDPEFLRLIEDEIIGRGRIFNK